MYWYYKPHIHTHTSTTYSLQHMRSLGIGSDDMIGEEKGKKKEYKFYVQRADGKYIFKVSYVCMLNTTMIGVYYRALC